VVGMQGGLWTDALRLTPASKELRLRNGLRNAGSMVLRKQHYSTGQHNATRGPETRPSVRAVPMRHPWHSLTALR
jgi:hypothetical protein